MSTKKRLNGLYVITDDALTPKDKMFSMIKEALKGGATIVQLRDKLSSDEEIKESAQCLQDLCRSHNALFVLNDKIEMAIELNLDGLHIGKSDHHRFEEIRQEFNGVIGVSCYGDIDLAKEMECMGADYVAFGSFYPSPTKPHANVVPLKTLSKAKKELNIPICAIGGINLFNVEEVMEHQPDMVSLVSDIWLSKDIAKQSSFYKKLF